MPSDRDRFTGKKLFWWEVVLKDGFTQRLKASSKTAAAKIARQEARRDGFTAAVKSVTKLNANPASRRKRKNPVKVAATVTGKGTGWIKSKFTRVVTKGGVQHVEIKR